MPRGRAVLEIKSHRMMMGVETDLEDFRGYNSTGSKALGSLAEIFAKS